MAPSMNFLIERMNIDIFILIFSLLAYIIEKHPHLQQSFTYIVTI